MSYDLHITKADHWTHSEHNPITKEDLAYVADLLNANEDIPFIFQQGRLTLCRADERVLSLMNEIAARLNARVQGDEGELYNHVDKSFSGAHAVSTRKGSAIEMNKSDYIIPDDQRKLIEALAIGDNIEE